MKHTNLMRRVLARRNVAAAAVLTLAASGVAYAAIGSSQITNNSLTSLDIKNSSLTGLDIKNETLTGADVKNKTLRGRDLADNSITGIQIDESTLAKVPSAAMADTATTATTATNADKVGGLAPTAFVSSDKVKFVSAKLAGGGTATLATNGSVSLIASCQLNDGGFDRLTVRAATTTNGAIIASDEDDLDGGLLPADFLNTDTLATDREILALGNTTAVPFVNHIIDGAYVLGPDGSYIGIDGESTTLGINYLGAVCLYAGYVHMGTIA